MKHITLEIDSDLGNVSLASVAVNAIALQAGLDGDAASQVELCLVEALTNIIRHAYHGELNRKVGIVVIVDAAHLRFILSDTGTVMATDKVERLIGEETATELEKMDVKLLSEGGRGLQIIRSVMDEVAYIREGVYNRLTLTKRIPSH